MGTSAYMTQKGCRHWLLTALFHILVRHWLLTALSFIIFNLSFSPAGAQVVATVVDAQTREPLPFASIFINKRSSTITNAEGSFSIKCEPTDVLRISFVGYKTAYISASSLLSKRKTIPLTPLENQLKEVTVTSVDLKKLIRKTTSEMRRQLRKSEKHKSCFFYRQTSFADSTCFELMEAFLQAKSAVYLRDLFLLNGRFAGIQPDSLHHYSFWTNYFTVSERPMLTRYDYHGNTDAMPLTRNYGDFYNLDYDVMVDSTGRLLAVHFIPKEEVKVPVFAATLYINENTHRLRKMEGEIRNVDVIHKDLVVVQEDTSKVVKEIKTYDKFTFRLTINMTEERGFVEVQSAYIDSRYERYGKQLTTRSILFNVGDLANDVNRNIQAWGFGDMHDYIRWQGYDPEFWHNNEMVLRTPVEERVLEMFERENLFGIMSP